MITFDWCAQDQAYMLTGVILSILITKICMKLHLLLQIKQHLILALLRVSILSTSDISSFFYKISYSYIKRKEDLNYELLEILNLLFMLSIKNWKFEEYDTKVFLADLPHKLFTYESERGFEVRISTKFWPIIFVIYAKIVKVTAIIVLFYFAVTLIYWNAFKGNWKRIWRARLEISAIPWKNGSILNRFF